MAFLGGRWRGEAPLSTVFWTEMALYGTLLNATTSFAALYLLTQGAPAAQAAAVFLAPLPVNLFLVVAVWRSAAAAAPLTRVAARTGAAVWFAAATAL